MTTIKLNDEEFAFLADLAKEMRTQKNRSTASPYYYTVRRTHKITGLDANYCGTDVWVDTGSGEYEQYATKAAFIEQYLKDFEGETEDQANEYADKHLEEFGQIEVVEDCNVFLTEKGYRQHMELNAHNYNNREDLSEPYSFLHHAFRNPEMQQLITLILKMGGQVEEK
jgi:hypothetical protein